MEQPIINWPAYFEPAASPVFVHNTISIQASPEKVWYWLTNAPTWSDWYANASNVKIIQPVSTQLESGSQFSWRTFGVNLQSTVKEFVPCQRLAWDAKGLGVAAYHTWLIIPSATGCTIITEETQHGLLCRLGKLFMPKRMYKQHQLWLQGLKQKAEDLA